jgi:hypothetical protein
MNLPRNTRLSTFTGSKKGVTRVYPALVFGREAASRDHAMDMWIDLQILSPGVQNAEETDLRAQMFGIGGNFFEHLIREIFEKEFSSNGGEVKVTQASRDGGVDAVAGDDQHPGSMAA